MLTLDELKERLAEQIDPDLVVELLELTTEEILDRFFDKLEEKRYMFSDYDDAE